MMLSEDCQRAPCCLEPLGYFVLLITVATCTRAPTLAASSSCPTSTSWHDVLVRQSACFESHLLSFNALCAAPLFFSCLTPDAPSSSDAPAVTGSAAGVRRCVSVSLQAFPHGSQQSALHPQLHRDLRTNLLSLLLIAREPAEAVA